MHRLHDFGAHKLSNNCSNTSSKECLRVYVLWGSFKEAGHRLVKRDRRLALSIVRRHTTTREEQSEENRSSPWLPKIKDELPKIKDDTNMHKVTVTNWYSKCRIVKPTIIFDNQQEYNVPGVLGWQLEKGAFFFRRSCLHNSTLPLRKGGIKYRSSAQFFRSLTGLLVSMNG